jgi:hypothetical protein
MTIFGYLDQVNIIRNLIPSMGLYQYSDLFWGVSCTARIMWEITYQLAHYKLYRTFL